MLPVSQYTTHTMQFYSFDSAIISPGLAVQIYGKADSSPLFARLKTQYNKQH
jgi:hypothetical protein